MSSPRRWTDNDPLLRYGNKNTEVQAYRTDPVQVRSCWFTSVPCLYDGLHLHWQPMWDKSICSL
ncbi:hypothetical protein Hanom_Chr16g01428581 [Helianthus anomalus]